MKKLLLFAMLSLAVALCVVPAFADTGNIPADEYGEPIYPELSVVSDGTTPYLHNEPVLQTDPHKGWWFASLTNNTANPWTTLTISSGVGDKVAVVKGNNLTDEQGFTFNSVSVNRTVSNWNYYTPLGDGTRDYGDGNIGYLYKGVTLTFATPVAVGSKVAFKVYTDNSYYAGPYADSFSITVTPNAVPEPSSLLALSGSVLGLTGFAWRRRR